LLSSGESSLDLNGFVLDIQDDGYFLTAPADSEGKVYTFEWDDLGILSSGMTWVAHSLLKPDL